MLKVGINWLSPYTLPTVHRLLDEGVADFCEIMVDNAVHLPASKILNALPDVPLALHIVSSNFLTKSAAELQDIAQHLQPWIAELNPIYVSDHLPQLNYQMDFANTAVRVREWQDLLKVKLLLENFPSMSDEGVGQAEFYARLKQETHCDVLFDFSNAFIAEYNGGEARNLWHRMIDKAHHFHVAGFQIDPKTKLAYDTHDVAIADEVLTLMQRYFSNTREQTIVFELDTKLDYKLAKQQILKLKGDLRAPVVAAKDVAAMEGDKRRVQGCTFLSATTGAREAAINKLQNFVTEWSLRGLDHILAKGILVRSKELPNTAVGLWKSTEPDQPAKLVTLDISSANLPPANAYAISYSQDNWAGLEWVELS